MENPEYKQNSVLSDFFHPHIFMYVIHVLLILVCPYLSWQPICPRLQVTSGSPKALGDSRSGLYLQKQLVWSFLAYCTFFLVLLSFTYLQATCLNLSKLL